MSVLNDNYKKIISEIEEKIQNPEDREFVKQKISELSITFMDVIDSLTTVTDEKIKKIEEKQQRIECKVQEVEEFVNDIEANIVEEVQNSEDEEYEFEIVCPYCDSEFITDINGKDKISCPECNNVIELDWDDEEENQKGCTGGCGACPGCSLEHNNEKDNYNEVEDDM